MLATLLLGAGAPETEEPLFCREVIGRRGGDPMEALRTEEVERWRAARRAASEGRKVMRRSLGAGDNPQAHAMMAEFEHANRRYLQAAREAQLLCRCRQDRGADDLDCSRRSR